MTDNGAVAPATSLRNCWEIGGNDENFPSAK